MGALSLKDGKFWRDGNEVSPKIGDPEMIALLKAEERRLTKMEEAGEIDASIRITSVECEISFKCVCGRHIARLHEPICPYEECFSVDDVYTTITCPHCGIEYECEDGIVRVVK